jgi:hypothetical protein
VDITAQNIQINDGGYYVSWHMSGENSPGIGIDNSPDQIGSRQSWEYTGAWSQFRYSEERDVMIRTSVSEVGTVPDMFVDLTYISGSPVPPGGGNLVFNVFVDNLETSPIDFDAWLDVVYQGSTPVTLINRSFTNFMPAWVINRQLSYPVQSNWPAGNYVMYGRTGDYPGTVYAEDSFPFSKSGTADGFDGILTIPAGVQNPFVVTDLSEVDLPAQFKLHGAYPNPFNPAATIRYEISEAVNVQLQVFDLTGRNVATLVNRHQNAGTYNVTFDASNLASGMYLYRLEADGFTASGKMLLMK